MRPHMGLGMHLIVDYDCTVAENDELCGALNLATQP